MMWSKNRYRSLFIILVLYSYKINTQTYVGTISDGNKVKYVNISKNNNQWILKSPFENDNISSFKNDILKEENSILIKGDPWYFEKLNQKKDVLKFRIKNYSGTQESLFFLQQKGPEKKLLSQYVGTYIDDQKKVTIIENQFDRLRIISPYSGETMFLKAIQDNTFWTTSGEQWVFNHSTDKIKHTSRLGKSTILLKEELFITREVWIPHLKDTIYGKLFIPTNVSTASPGCLILQGGGSVGLKNYEYEAHFLAANGIMTLMCNKSGEGKSKGESNFNYQTFDEKIAEYNALFEFLKNQPNIDKNKVGVHGISEGGRLALSLGAYNKNVAFIMAGAAPIMSFIDGQLYAMNQLHRDLNIDESINLKIQNIWKTYYDNIIEGKIDKNNIKLANKLRNIHPQIFLPPNSTEVPGSPRKEDLLGSISFKDLSNIKAPILLQYGENDHRVHPFKSIHNFKNHIDSTTNWEKIIYKGVNHSFMSPEFQIAPNYLKDKINWLKSIHILN